MTEVVTTTNPFEEYFDTSEIDDGTTIVSSAGAARIAEYAKNTLTQLKSAASLSNKLASVKKAVAWQLMLMAVEIVDASGYPILSMETGKASEYVKRFQNWAYNEFFPIPSGEGVTDAMKSDARTARQNILTGVRLHWGGRKGVGGMREIVATHYVIRNIGNYNLTPEQVKQMQRPGFLKWSDADPDLLLWPEEGETDREEATYLKVVPVFLKKPIGDIYRHSGLDVPVKFGGAPKDAPETKQKKMTAEQFVKNVGETVTHLTPVNAYGALLVGLKALVRGVLEAKGGMIEDTAHLVSDIEEFHAINTLFLKRVKAPGSFSEKDAAALLAAVEVPDIQEVIAEEVAKVQAAAKAEAA